MEINRYVLDNGLKIIHSKDATTKMVAFNILYNVGSKDEKEGNTGLAHFFEHLMFGGSCNVKDFDYELQRAGGESNAWTSDDITNFYEVLPSHNIETAFWLESDRMIEPSLDDNSIEVQRSVVIEEFKQRCLNQPYGDLEHIMRNAAFDEHPYKWPVIGRSVEEIENISKDDIKKFFYSHYAPNNAILCISGNIEFDEVVRLSQKWFGSIERRLIAPKNLIQEKPQKAYKELSVKKDVPHNIIYRGYKMCGRLDDKYHTYDLMSDILANGNSSRFIKNIVKRGVGFISLDSSVWGSLYPGLFLVKGSLLPGVSFSEGKEIIDKELMNLINGDIEEAEIEKCINKVESRELFSNLNYAERASNLAYYELLGNANMIFDEINKYKSLSPSSFKNKNLLKDDNCTTILYGPDA